jgi:hypothetical protein
MSKHHKHSKYGPQLVVEASEHFTLQVLNHAEKSGAKVGAKIAKRALKNARGRGTDLNALQTDELLLAAQQAGASAALAAARRVLGKSLGSKEPTRQGIDADHTSFQSERETTSSANNGFGQHVLAVKRVEKLSPEMIRVIAGAKQLAGYRQNGKADQYVKVSLLIRRLASKHRTTSKPCAVHCRANRFHAPVPIRFDGSIKRQRS